MLVDKEGNSIEPILDINKHIKIYGVAGSGKTFYTCRLMEELSEKIPVIVIDYSGSYTVDELSKNHFNEEMKIQVFDPFIEPINLYCGNTMEDVIENVMDSLLVLIPDMAITQQDILKETCEDVILVNGYISIKKIYLTLKNKLQTEGLENSYYQNIEHLMRKLLNMREVDDIRMTFGDEIFDAGVAIYQLSDFPERTRKIIGQLIVELIWKKIYHKKQRVQIVLDEFQNLKLANTAVEAMLREGRRYGIGVIMISQYAPLGKEKDVLEQAITSFYFRPNSRNLESIAKMIDYENYKDWKIILRKLNRGECIFVGDYKINNKTPSNLEPLLCEVKK